MSRCIKMSVLSSFDAVKGCLVGFPSVGFRIFAFDAKKASLNIHTSIKSDAQGLGVSRRVVRRDCPPPTPHPTRGRDARQLLEDQH